MILLHNILFEDWHERGQVSNTRRGYLDDEERMGRQADRTRGKNVGGKADSAWDRVNPETTRKGVVRKLIRQVMSDGSVKWIKQTDDPNNPNANKLPKITGPRVPTAHVHEGEWVPGFKNVVFGGSSNKGRKHTDTKQKFELLPFIEYYNSNCINIKKQVSTDEELENKSKNGSLSQDALFKSIDNIINILRSKHASLKNKLKFYIKEDKEDLFDEIIEILHKSKIILNNRYNKAANAYFEFRKLYTDAVARIKNNIQVWLIDFEKYDDCRLYVLDEIDEILENFDDICANYDLQIERVYKLLSELEYVEYESDNSDYRFYIDYLKNLFEITKNNLTNYLAKMKLTVETSNLKKNKTLIRPEDSVEHDFQKQNIKSRRKFRFSR